MVFDVVSGIVLGIVFSTAPGKIFDSVPGVVIGMVLKTVPGMVSGT